MAGPDVEARKTKESAWGEVLCFFTLLLIGIMAFSIRLFSVIKYESLIHEFDPYFNYRVSQFLVRNGPVEMWNWFDENTWYPLGRVIGGTVYPGLMMTAGTMWWLLQSLNIPISIGDVCVFTAPTFSALCAWSTYLLTKEVKGSGAGLTAAALIATVPSYISRSVAGSYDNEAVAIFALVLTFFLYVKTLNTGSLAWGTANALALFYMVCSWGGYTFIINLIPIHALLTIITGRYSSKLYVAYAPLIITGTLLAASVPVVGFLAVRSSEHFASFIVFGILHVCALVAYCRGLLPPRQLKLATSMIVGLGMAIAAALASILVALVAASPTLGWSGRSLSLLDPTYASRNIPIIASVSEHQPPAWTSYFMDLHFLVFLVPAGIVACFLPLTDTSSFLVLYAVTAVYFSGVMVRLMLVLAPAACILGGIALSEGFHVFTRSVKHAFYFPREAAEAKVEQPLDLDPAPALKSKGTTPGPAPKSKDITSTSTKKSLRRRPSTASEGSTGTSGGGGRSNRGSAMPEDIGASLGARVWALPWELSVAAVLLMLALCTFFVVHCVWASAEAYSAPSIVLSSRGRDGSNHVFDDFREAYSWLRHNTDPNCKVASWWDYGYQTTAMANRTVIVDNNTWNNTHIATVGMAMASPERQAWEIYRSLDVNYVFVVFGGMVGYPSDDINKFLWMVRIGGGVYPHIKEADYLANGVYRIDSEATSTMLNCLMYKLSYYRFAEATGGFGQATGFDRVRNAEIGKKNVKLKYFEEVFTTHHWMVRIYKVKEPTNRVKGKPRKRTTGKK